MCFKCSCRRRLALRGPRSGTLYYLSYPINECHKAVSVAVNGNWRQVYHYNMPMISIVTSLSDVVCGPGLPLSAGGVAKSTGVLVHPTPVNEASLCWRHRKLVFIW